jgi:hypothetical protein
MNFFVCASPLRYIYANVFHEENFLVPHLRMLLRDRKFVDDDEADYEALNPKYTSTKLQPGAREVTLFQPSENAEQVS